MIKQTLHFSRPAYLSLHMDQLRIASRADASLPIITRPIEDLGMVILEHPQITLTHGLIRRFMRGNIVVVTCDEHHMPSAYMLPTDGHTLVSKHAAAQLEASLPLKKYLWQQTIIAKVYNQARILARYQRSTARLDRLVKRVTAGDRDNIEGQAAAHYWIQLMGDEWCRDRYGAPPNYLLNYGYAILRALVARALVSSGLLLLTGIHHRNQYNPYCLADDIMEPYRPYVDGIVYDIVEEQQSMDIELTRDIKSRLLSIATEDVWIQKKKRPLMVALTTTSASLVACYQGRKKKIAYAKMS